jgi:hypothetical protein
MSRSRRVPWITDGYKGSKRKQFFKNYANKVVRKSRDIPNGKAYKKFFCSYDICDYKWYVDLNDEFYKKEFWKYTRK